MSSFKRPADFVIVFLILISVALGIWYWLSMEKQTVSIDGKRYLTFKDDTYIIMHYGLNLRSGQGLVWNAGEKPVEGATSFLWPVVIALLSFFNADPSYLLFAATVFLHLLSLWLFWRILDNTGFPAFFQMAGIFLMAIWFPIRTQVLNATDYPLALALFIAALFFISRRTGQRETLQKVLAILTAALLPLARPETFILSIIVFVCFLIRWDYSIREWKKIVFYLCLLLAPVAVLTVFRIFYFGEWLPNTYFLKVLNRPGRIIWGLSYVKNFLFEFLIHGGILLFPLSIFVLADKRNTWLKGLGSGVFLIIAYVVYIGGDAWSWNRFLTPLMPVFLLLLFNWLNLLLEKKEVSQGLFVYTLLICVTAYSLHPLLQDYKRGILFSKAHEDTANNIRLGLLLDRTCKADVVIADFWTGAPPFYSKRKTIDMLGNSDRHIARLAAYAPQLPPGHDKFDIQYVVDRKPDVIIGALSLRAAEDKEMVQYSKNSNFRFGGVLVENKSFLDEYRAVESRLSREWRAIYIRNDSAKCDVSLIPEEERKLF